MWHHALANNSLSQFCWGNQKEEILHSRKNAKMSYCLTRFFFTQQLCRIITLELWGTWGLRQFALCNIYFAYDWCIMVKIWKICNGGVGHSSNLLLHITSVPSCWTKRDSRHSNNLNGRIQIYVNHKMFHEGSGIDLLVS